MTPTPPSHSSFQSHFRFRRSRNANQYDASHNLTPTAAPPVAPLVDDRFNEDGDLVADNDVDDEEEGAEDGDDSNLEQEGNDGEEEEEEEEEDEDEEEGGIEEGLLLHVFSNFWHLPSLCFSYVSPKSHPGQSFALPLSLESLEAGLVDCLAYLSAKLEFNRLVHAGRCHKAMPPGLPRWGTFRVTRSNGRNDRRIMTPPTPPTVIPRGLPLPRLPSADIENADEFINAIMSMANRSTRDDTVPMEIDAPFDPTALGLKEIGNLASWTVSSCKPGCGVEALRDEDTGLFWQ